MKQLFFFLLLAIPFANHAQQVASPANMQIEIVNVPQQFVVTKMYECTKAEVTDRLTWANSDLNKFIQSEGLTAKGNEFAIMHPTPDGSKVMLEVGFPVDKQIESGDQIKVSNIPAHKAVKASYYGSRTDISNAYPVVKEWMGNQKMTAKGDASEVYVTDASSITDMSKCLTEIYFPVQ